jgi:hypothetical protein
VSLFFSIVTLFLSIAVAIIAAVLWWVVDNKLRLDLFDRRYKVYDAARQLIVHIISRANLDDSQLCKFNAETLDAEFLFDADVVSFLDALRDQALKIQAARKLLECSPAGDEHSRQAQIQHDAIQWFRDQLRPMTTVFKSYLGFANVGLKLLPPLKFKFPGQMVRAFAMPSYHDSIVTNEGIVHVLTKTRCLFVVPMPCTSVMPPRGTELSRLGTSIRWITADAATLRTLHDRVVELVREIGVFGIREIANTAKTTERIAKTIGATWQNIVKESARDDAPFAMSDDVLHYVKRFV